MREGKGYKGVGVEGGLLQKGYISLPRLLLVGKETKGGDIIGQGHIMILSDLSGTRKTDGEKNTSKGHRFRTIHSIGDSNSGKMRLDRQGG